MLDGLVQDINGEVIEARDAPRNLFSVPGSVLELDRNHSSLKWYALFMNNVTYFRTS